MYYLMGPFYLLVASIMCMYFTTTEYVEGKGKINVASSSLIFSWVLTSLVVTSIVAGVSAELTVGMTNGMHLLIAIMAATVTLIVSSLIVSYS